MGMVAPLARIASAFVVLFGKHGQVSRQARERGICRQRLYREAIWVTTRLEADHQQQEMARLRDIVHDLQQQLGALEQRLARCVELDDDKLAQFASVGQARGVTLTDLHELLSVFLGEQTPSRAKLGRWAKVAGEKAGLLLQVLDPLSQPLAKQVAADEIYVRDPVLMTIEQRSLCWLGGRLTDSLTGEAWAKEFEPLSAVEQVTRDGGRSLQNGVALLNQKRQEQGLAPVADHLDHFHTLWGGQKGVRKAEKQVRQALDQIDTAEADLEKERRQGRSLAGPTARLTRYWMTANKAMDRWEQRDHAWKKTKEALQLITPEGELNSRPRAEAILAETLPQLPDADFAKTKRMLKKKETLTHLDEVHRKLQALAIPPEVRDAALQSECLRRRHQALQGPTARAAALRGVLLMCGVILAKAGDVGQQAIGEVRSILSNTWRASSLVECVNSVLRMQQARHRKMTQGMLDLKRLYWNCHVFRTGPRRGTSPYQRLGITWPEELPWWDIIKMTPEQLREKLSALKTAA
jgi:hypothetical protein